jgi:hypothetical protein
MLTPAPFGTRVTFQREDGGLFNGELDQDNDHSRSGVSIRMPDGSVELAPIEVVRVADWIQDAKWSTDKVNRAFHPRGATHFSGKTKVGKMKRLYVLLLILFTALLHLPACAEVIGKIDFPPTLGSLNLRSVTELEKTHPGLGISLLYDTPGVKAHVFVYNRLLRNIPDGVDSTLVRKEFAEAKGNIAQVYPDARPRTQDARVLVQGIPTLHSEFEYTDVTGFRERVFSLLYLTGRNGNFVKARVTYSATNQPDRGRRISDQFIESLSGLLAK